MDKNDNFDLSKHSSPFSPAMPPNQLDQTVLVFYPILEI
jgi:hypothetical protein